jgi:hypothetical protein
VSAFGNSAEHSDSRVPAARALDPLQVVEGYLRGLNNKSDVSSLPTPGKAEIHEALEGLVNVLACGDCRVDKHARGDNDFALDAFLVFVGKSYAIQSDCRWPRGGGICAWIRPAHDLGFYGPFDFLDKLRMDVEIFEGSCHGMRLSKQGGVFQFVFAVWDLRNLAVVTTEGTEIQKKVKKCALCRSRTYPETRMTVCSPCGSARCTDGSEVFSILLCSWCLLQQGAS